MEWSPQGSTLSEMRFLFSSVLILMSAHLPGSGCTWCLSLQPLGGLSVLGAITTCDGCFYNTFSPKQLLELPALLNSVIFIRSALEHPFWCIVGEPLCKLLVVTLCLCTGYWIRAEGKLQRACCYIGDLAWCLKCYTANRLLHQIQQRDSIWCIAKKYISESAPALKQCFWKHNL